MGFRRGVDDNGKNRQEARHSSAVIKRLGSINVDVVRLPAGKDAGQAEGEFQGDNEVAFAERDYVAHADALAPNDPLYAQQYGPQKLRAVDAQGIVYSAGYPVFSGGNPSSVTHPLIAVTDSGVAGASSDRYANSDLVDKVLAKAADCTSTSSSSTQVCPTSAPYDDFGHGTHVAGIAAAETNNGTGIVGIAPGAEVVSIKVLDSGGFGYWSWIASGILCAADLSRCGLGSGHADVVNLSIGGSPGSATLQSAVASAQSAGVVIVAAAGNSNSTSLSAPAAYADLSVIATDASDRRASFSNYGGYANQVSAPGVNILSTVSKDTNLPISDTSGYALLSGTSMATPHVAGLAALLAGQGLSRQAIVDRIKQTTDLLPSSGGTPDTAHFGAGRVNAFKALSLGPDFALSTSPPTVTVAPGAQAGYTVNIARTGGFTGAVDLSITSGLPAGASASFNPPSATGSSSALTVTTASSTPAGSYTLSIAGAAGSLSHSASVGLAVVVPDFALSANPSSATVARGGTTTYAVNITRTGGFTDPVTMSVSGLPAGANAAFNPAPATGNSSTLTVTTGSTTPVGSYAVSIGGTNGTLSRATSAGLVVVSSDFSLAAAPASASVSRGSSVTYTVTINRTGGFSGAVALKATGLPSQTTATFTPSSTTANSSSLKITTVSGTPAGTYTVTISGTSGSLSHTTTVKLVVTSSCNGEC